MPSAAVALQSLLDAANPATEAPSPDASALAQVKPANFDPYADSRREFADLITGWMRVNNWTLDTPAVILRAAGFGYLSVHNSQMSQTMNAKLDPKPKYFACLAKLNELVADRSWAKPGLLDPRTRMRLDNAYPLATPEGRPWGAVDFFAAFIGE